MESEQNSKASGSNAKVGPKLEIPIAHECTFIYEYVYICVHIHIYIYRNTYKNTYIYIHTHSLNKAQHREYLSEMDPRTLGSDVRV